MEVLVRVIAQGEAVKRDWTNTNGETKKITSVEVHLKSGIDEFVAEASGDLADTIENNKLDINGLYSARVEMAVRTSKEKKLKFTNIRLLKIEQL